MIADDYVIWHISDPTKYYQTLGAIRNRAEERIEAAVYNATKNTISSMKQEEIIAARGSTLTDMITKEANSDISQYGIVIGLAEIKALDLPDDNRTAVYERMISERNNIAASYEAEGAAEAQKIKNETDKKVSILKAEAEKTAAKLTGEGEAEYMKTLSEAYNTPEKAEFYNFMRSIDAFEESLGNGEKTIILDKNSELARMFYMNN
jgi:membrane protease subunit HflC